MTPYQKHKKRWQDCKKCSLCKRRRKVCLLRASPNRLPSSVLFIGEAPGASEDVLGQPFVGPAGKLLNWIIQEARGDKLLRHTFTNLIGCIPRENGGKMGEPPREAIKACQPRLAQIVSVVRPKLIICVGTLATKYAGNSFSVETVKIIHPAAILRMDVSQKGLATQRTMVVVRDAVAPYLEEV